MTDNRTTELLPCPFCGSKNVETSYKDTFSGDFRRGVYCADCRGGIYPYYDTEAEAIAAWNTRAAKLCYATDYTHEHCKYSVNRGWTEDTRFYISTPAKQKSGTLTAEQVRDAIERHITFYEGGDYNEQAIADELNAKLGSGTCENISDPPEGFLCSECGWGDFAEPSHLLTTAKFTDNDRGPNHCPNCGRRVER